MRGYDSTIPADGKVIGIDKAEHDRKYDGHLVEDPLDGLPSPVRYDLLRAHKVIKLLRLEVHLPIDELLARTDLLFLGLLVLLGGKEQRQAVVVGSRPHRWSIRS